MIRISRLVAVLIALFSTFEGKAIAHDLPAYVIEAFGHPPAVPEGDLPPELRAAARVVFEDSLDTSAWADAEAEALDIIANSGDPRLGWVIADMLRFTWRREFHAALTDAAATLLGIEYETFHRQHEITDHLIAWDIPSYPDYLATKRQIFTQFVPGWDNIFVEGGIDWRLVAWGGVPIDARPYNQTDEACSCIPAADNPPVSSASEATWLQDSDIVFGIEINGEARAYPRRIMEVREMVNDTLGGRDLGIPYCSLCAAAQAFFTDEMPSGVERPILRTSGLLIRSNKVMYDIRTHSVFDTFLGRAVTGPLAEKGIALPQATVVTTDWGSWKAAYPETTVLVEELALGRDFDLRNQRDKNGPIFPIGDVDPRLPVHEDIIGVITQSGTPVAFPRAAAFLALSEDAEVKFENVRLQRVAGGIRATGADGSDLGSHQAFWFAWSQFHPDTALWSR
ncbi:MAG: DUF3179 domain-containing (seleno)protein [Pseudomonadota bacterium]